MKFKTKAWLVSQGLLILTAIIIQLTFYREIKVGPLLGMPKRPYLDIIQNVEPGVPDYAKDRNLKPKMYDARLPLSQDEIQAANLSAYRRAYRQEEGLRMALKGGFVVNIIYFIAYHLLVPYFTRSLAKGRASRRNE
jgi:hypothetical protein